MLTNSRNRNAPNGQCGRKRCLKISPHYSDLAEQQRCAQSRRRYSCAHSLIRAILLIGVMIYTSTTLDSDYYPFPNRAIPKTRRS
jgi:hypothetical protein